MKSKFVVLNKYIKTNVGMLFFSFEDKNLYYSEENKGKDPNYIFVVFAPLFMLAFVLTQSKNIELKYQEFGNMWINTALIAICLLLITIIWKRVKARKDEKILVLLGNSSKLHLFPERNRSLYYEGISKACIYSLCELAIITVCFISFCEFIKSSRLAFLFGGLLFFIVEISMCFEEYDTIKALLALRSIKEKASRE